MGFVMRKGSSVRGIGVHAGISVWVDPRPEISNLELSGGVTKALTSGATPGIRSSDLLFKRLMRSIHHLFLRLS
jgi:hypothetical protein